jgi:large subunit ribosomal protein L17
MRHGKKINHLGRTSSHRKSLLSNLATSLITHKRITTTVAKAKALRTFVEPLLNKSKTDSTHSRRVVFSYLQNKEAVTELFREVSGKIAERNGGYTRIIKLGARPGDNAEMALIELVDFNTTFVKGGKASAKKRTRRGSKATAKTEAAPASEPAEEKLVAGEDASAEESQQPENEA